MPRPILHFENMKGATGRSERVFVDIDHEGSSRYGSERLW